MTTPLEALLIRRIRATGPITLADYMAECLLHPEYGYYTTRPPFGRDGDFITAPEVSQTAANSIETSAVDTTTPPITCGSQCWRRPAAAMASDRPQGTALLMPVT